MRAQLLLVAGVIVCFSFGSVAKAQDLLPTDNGIYEYHKAPEYRESESHPLRILAYVLHGPGWLLREGIFRPFSAFASSTPFTRSFLGYRDPFDYREAKCFNRSDSEPDCHLIPPLSQIGASATMGDGSAGGKLNEEVATKQVFIPDVAFEFDKSSLNALGRGRVRQIAQLLSSVPSLKVSVEGHTDGKGSDKYNEALGERRANTVIKELTDLGVDPARMSPVSLGKNKPIFTENTDWADAVNRRVQFTVQGG